MARLRPARTCRRPNSQAWARYSIKKPRKNYVRALPHTSLLVFNMGVQKDDYDMDIAFCPIQDIQLRSNAIEAARLTTNKYLENELPQAYSFKILVYPHNVIREHKMATGAGADRLSKGMTQSFGRPVSIAARIKKGQALFRIKTYKQNRKKVVEALRRANSKLSGSFNITTA